jgi:hypothetical protein
MPESLGPAERLTLLVLAALEQRDGEATPSHRKLGALVGHSAKSSQRATHKLARVDALAIEPCFWSDDHQQTSNSYAVLALPMTAAVDPPDRLTRGRARVPDQQKEIPEETVAARVSPVDNCPPVDDPTPEDRAALAAAARGLKFPKREKLPDPEPGSPLAEVQKRWGWDAYSDALDVVESPRARASPEAVAPALAELLRRPRDRIDTPGAYLRSALKRIASGAGGPGLCATRPPFAPAPDSIAAKRLVLIGLRESCPPGERRCQLDLAIHEMSRELVRQMKQEAS